MSIKTTLSQKLTSDYIILDSQVLSNKLCMFFGFYQSLSLV
jgi:hypothetical protein